MLKEIHFLISFCSHITSINSFPPKRQKQKNNLKMSLDGVNPPLRHHDKELATVSEGCSVIQANQRPPRGSITVHCMLTPLWDEKLFMGMWMCGRLYVCNGVSE